MHSAAAGCLGQSTRRTRGTEFQSHVKGSSSRTQGPAQSFGETANTRTDAESCRTVWRPTHQPIIATLWFPKQSSRNPKITYIDIMMCTHLSRPACAALKSKPY
jgi:hypothetical protein